MKFSDLRKQSEDARRQVASLKSELEIERSVTLIRLGEVPRGVAVEFRIKQQIDEMQYMISRDRPGYMDSIEAGGMRSLMREVTRHGFVSMRVEPDLKDPHMKNATMSIFVVRP